MGVNQFPTKPSIPNQRCFSLPPQRSRYIYTAWLWLNTSLQIHQSTVCTGGPNIPSILEPAHLHADRWQCRPLYRCVAQGEQAGSLHKGTANTNPRATAHPEPTPTTGGFRSRSEEASQNRQCELGLCSGVVERVYWELFPLIEQKRCSATTNSSGPYLEGPAAAACVYTFSKTS